MHVLHLIKSLGLGGAENLLLATARRRSDAAGGITYSFAFFVPWKDALVEPLRETGVEVACFPARWHVLVPISAPRVAAYMRRHRIDLVHCHLPLAGVAGRLAGALAGVPVVYTEHNLLERYHPLTRRANLATWRLQRAVVAVSDEVADSISRHLRPRTAAWVPVRVVLNGVPVERLRRDREAGAAIRRELGIPQEASVVGQVAVFRTQKRLDLWLRAAAGILRERPDTRFLLVGDGPTRAEVKAEAATLGLGDRLLLPGLRSDPRPYLAAMDLLLISSEFEGLPLVLLEAMAMELPVVATAVGGVPQAVVPGETGVLVPPGSPEALAAAALPLLADPEARERLGGAGRRRVAERFGTGRMLDELEALYREVLADGRA